MICIPTTFHLGGRKWKVKIEDILDDDKDCLGLTDSDEAVIYLKAGMGPELTNHTFYHELEHAFRATLGLKDGKKEHGEVDARGGILLQYLSSKRGRCGGTNS
jgi:hypothetical protein